MTSQGRDIQRKLKVLRHAEQTGHVAKTCRYFGIGRTGTKSVLEYMVRPVLKLKSEAFRER